MNLLWNCSEIALKLLWNCEIGGNCSEIALKLLWNCSKTVQLLGTALKLLWDCAIAGNCSESALKLWNWWELLWKCSGVALNRVVQYRGGIIDGINENMMMKIAGSCCGMALLNNGTSKPSINDVTNDWINKEMTETEAIFINNRRSWYHHHRYINNLLHSDINRWKKEGVTQRSRRG